MSERQRSLNAVFGRFRRPMLSADLSIGTVEQPKNPDNPSEPAQATSPDPPRLPVRALGEYVPGGRVDAMRRLLSDR